MSDEPVMVSLSALNALSRAAFVARLAEWLKNGAGTGRAEVLRQVGRIAALRLEALIAG